MKIILTDDEARKHIKRGMRTAKICIACNVRKPLDQFVRRAKAPQGRASICSACFAAKMKKACAVPKQHGRFEKVKLVNMEARRCTCQPHRVGEYLAHDAGCMIFAHNQLDGIKRENIMNAAAAHPFRRLWR